MLPSWQDIVRFFSEQWRVISGARVSFFGGLLLLGVIVGAIEWNMLSWRYSVQLDNKDSVISTKDATISQQSSFLEEYRNKLKGASPGEVVKKITELEAEVRNLESFKNSKIEREWLPLKEGEISRWAVKLSRYPQDFLAVFFEDESSAMFRESLYSVFEKAGWPNPTVLNGGRGIGIMFKANADEPAGSILLELFKSVTPRVEWTKDEAMHKIQIYIWQKPKE
jgi:hypothetical protein